MDVNLKTEIKESIESSIRKFFKDKDVKNFHVLDLLFQNERRIRSLIGGLETSLGTTVWKPIAEVIAKSNDFVVEDKNLLMPKPFPQILSQEIDNLRQLWEKKEALLPREEYIARLREAALKSDREDLNYIVLPPKKGVDLYLSKNGKEYAFDLKSVQINSNRSGG